MMLKAKPRHPHVTMPQVVSLRLTDSQAEQLAWLMTHLNMTKSEVVQALIEQEYVVQTEKP